MLWPAHPPRGYTVQDGQTVVRPPKRFQGYLGASPTVEWLNRETGMQANMRPYVVDLTDATVDAFVSDARHDVLLEFYAPWCGHCKLFAPFYFEVGAHFASDDHVRIARVDVDAHRDVARRFNVTGLPSLQLFPRGYKVHGLHFKGAERKPAAIISFVKSPQVYLVEAQVTDMPQWACVVWLEAKGVLRAGSVSGAVGLTAHQGRDGELDWDQDRDQDQDVQMGEDAADAEGATEATDVTGATDATDATDATGATDATDTTHANDGGSNSSNITRKTGGGARYPGKPLTPTANVRSATLNPKP